jgi:hypothetical protein
MFPVETVSSTVRRAATSGFVVPGFMSSDGGYLGDPVVHTHEVGIFSELGDDFSCVNPLGLSCYHGDGHRHYSGVVCTRLAT